MATPANSGITLVLGAPNSGKRGLALEWWQERLAQRPVLVLPTIPDAEDMTAEMARRVGGSMGQSPAVNFAGLVRLILGPEVRILSEFERALIVAELLGTVRSEALDPVIHMPGVTAAVLELLQELGDCGRSFPEVEQILGRWGEGASGASPIAGDTLRLVRAYREALGRAGVCDQATAVRQATASADGWLRPVAFCGFTSFTRGQKVLVRTLADQTEVLLTFDHDREVGAGLCAPGEVEWWIGPAREVLDVSPRTRAYASTSLAGLERGLLTGEESAAPPRKSEGDGGVRFLLSSGRRAEAESVAQRVAELIGLGFDPGGIAVVVRQIRGQGQLLGDVFASCGIPYQSDERRTLGETGLGFAFLRALRGVAEDDAESLLGFLRSPYSGAPAERVSDVETRYRQGAGRGSRALTRVAYGDAAAALESAWALLAVTPAAGIETQTFKVQGDIVSGSHGSDTAERELRLDAAEALATRALIAGARGATVCDAGLEEDASAFGALQSSLAAMRATGGGFTAASAQRLLALAEVASQAQIDRGAVQIISAQRARARRFDAVFVLGLVEGEFPGVHEPPSLLSAKQRATLDRMAGGIFPPEPAGERALFVGAATRAWRLLYLSARDAEDDGSEAVPSRFWTEAKALLGVGQDVHESRGLSDQVFKSNSAPSLRHYLRSCAAEGLDSGVDGFARPVWARGMPHLEDEDVLAELGSLSCFSPSALESYCRCPFAWFIDRVIGREEIEQELDGRMLGDLVHRVLGECYRSLSSDGLLPLTTACVVEADRRADLLIQGMVDGPGCAGSVAERRLAAHRLRQMTHRLFEAEAGWGSHLAFSEAEASVGSDGGVDVGGLRIRGRVDRIDSTPDAHKCFVLDYKSGSAPAASAIGGERGLQLPLYLMALGAERDDQQVLGGAYLSLADGRAASLVAEGSESLLGALTGKARVMDNEQWKELRNGVLSISLTAAGGMRAGVISPFSDRDCPDWCDLGPVCRSRRGGRRP